MIVSKEFGVGGDGILVSHDYGFNFCEGIFSLSLDFDYYFSLYVFFDDSGWCLGEGGLFWRRLCMFGFLLIPFGNILCFVVMKGV